MNIFDAIRNGDSAAAAQLLDADPSLASARQNQISPLLFATYLGRADIVRLLLDRGAPVSFAEACAIGDAGLALRLLDADPSLLDQRSEDGFPPLGLAIFFRHPDLARTLIERGADVNAAAENRQRVRPLHAAASVGDLETMRLLLERGADPNTRQELDFTPLHGAAARGDVEMARLLLAHGAGREPKSSDGKSPADVAREHGKEAFLAFLASQ